MGARRSGLTAEQRAAERLLMSSWVEWMAARLEGDGPTARLALRAHVAHALELAGDASKKQGVSNGDKKLDKRRAIAVDKAPTGRMG